MHEKKFREKIYSALYINVCKKMSKCLDNHGTFMSNLNTMFIIFLCRGYQRNSSTVKTLNKGSFWKIIPKLFNENKITFAAVVIICRVT